MGKTKTHAQWLREAKDIHGDKYDYSESHYFGAEYKIKIICPIHGEFMQRAYRHLQGCGCQKCADLSIKKFKSQEKLISELQKIYGDIFDYSKVKYVGSEIPITLICSVHGEFEQTPANLLKGHSCKKCSYENKKAIYTTESYVDKCIDKFGNRFIYDKTIFTKINKSIIIGCSKCNKYFERTASVHLQYGCECPYCKQVGVSKGEKEIVEYIQSIYSGDTLTSKRDILDNGFELDIYIPYKKIAIEFDGLYWHNELNKPKDYHINKTEDCETKQIQLIHIFEDEWVNKQEIVKSRIRQALGLCKYKIFARKCTLRPLTVEQERNFLNNNHLQGYVASTVCYGLFFTEQKTKKEYLVSCMSFGKMRKNLGSVDEAGVFEMYRFTSLKNFTIVGGASKLFKHFINTYKPKKIISFADRRYSVDSENNLYRKLGFEFTNKTEISYFYCIGNKRINRFGMRKDILVSKYNCPTTMTERDFCFSQKMYRIYDCGNNKYTWNNKP